MFQNRAFAQHNRGFRSPNYNQAPTGRAPAARGAPPSRAATGSGLAGEQQPQPQPQPEQSGETLSSFESDYDLLLYIGGETETEDIVDTERSLDYQDQTWRASVCGGASLAQTIDGSLSELLAAGRTPDFELLEYGDEGSPRGLQQQQQQPADECDQEVSRVFSSLVNAPPPPPPAASTLDRHVLRDRRLLGAMDQRQQQQQRSRTLDRRHQQSEQQQVSGHTDDLDKLLAEMSSSIDLNALARYDSAAPNQKAPVGGGALEPPRLRAGVQQASSDSILEELDGASRMLEQMIAEQFPNRRPPGGAGKPPAKQESQSSSCESPRSVISKPYQIPEPACAVVDNSSLPSQAEHVIPVELEPSAPESFTKQQESSIWSPRRLSLRASRPREEPPPPPPPLPERDYDTDQQQQPVITLEPALDTGGGGAHHLDRMRRRTMSGVRRMRDRIGDLIGAAPSGAPAAEPKSQERPSRSLTRRRSPTSEQQQHPSLGSQIRERLSRSRSRVSRWWHRTTSSKRARSTPNTRTAPSEDEDDGHLFPPGDIARLAGGGGETPDCVERVRASSSSSSSATHLSGLERTDQPEDRWSRRSSKRSPKESGAAANRRRKRASSLLSLKRFSLSALRPGTPAVAAAAKEPDLDSIQVSVSPVGRRRRERQSECATGSPSADSEAPEREYFSRANPKSQSLRSVRRAPSLSSLAGSRGNRLAPTTNTFRAASAQASHPEPTRPPSPAGAHSARAQTITPVAPSSAQHEQQQQQQQQHLSAAHLKTDQNQPLGLRTKSATMLSELRHRCGNLLRTSRPAPPREPEPEPQPEPQRPPRRSKSVAAQGVSLTPGANRLEWRPVIEAPSGKQLDGSVVAPRVMLPARRPSADSESTWECSEGEPESPSCELRGGALPATSAEPPPATTSGASERAASRAQQVAPPPPQQLAQLEQPPQASASVAGVCAKPRPPPPPPPPLPKQQQQQQHRPSAGDDSKTSLLHEPASWGPASHHTMEGTRAPVAGQEGAGLWRFQFSDDLPEPAKSWPQQQHLKEEEDKKQDEEADDNRISTYENAPPIRQPEQEPPKPLEQATPEPASQELLLEDASVGEPRKPARASLAAKPPRPERKLVKMLSIIQDPCDELMVAANRPARRAARSESIRSLASVFDAGGSTGTLSQTNQLEALNQASCNSDSESSLVGAGVGGPRQRLLARFEQAASGKPAPPSNSASATTGRLAGVFGGQRAGSRVRRLAKNFDQGAAAAAGISEEEEAAEEARSEQLSWHDAEQLDEAEVARFLEELGEGPAAGSLASSLGVSTGADPFVTVADETLVSDQEDDNTLAGDNSLADETAPPAAAAGHPQATPVSRAQSRAPISPSAEQRHYFATPPPPPPQQSPHLKAAPSTDQNDNVIVGLPPAASPQPPAIESAAVAGPQQDPHFRSSLNRLIGRRISVPLASADQRPQNQQQPSQQQVSMTTTAGQEPAPKSKSPSSELRGLSRYYRALLSRRQKRHARPRQGPKPIREVLDDSIASSSSNSSSAACSEAGSSSDDDGDEGTSGVDRSARFCEQLERMLAKKAAMQQQQQQQVAADRDSLSGDEPGSLSSSSAVSYESLPEVRQRQVLQKLYHTAQEIHSSEAKFVETLKLLNEDLRAHLEGVPAQQCECLARLLKHLPQLQALNESLLSELASACQQWPTTRKIAHVLVKMGPFLKHYSAYIRDFDGVQQQLADCQRRWPQLAERLRSFEATDRCQKLSVLHHLLRPVQRIPQYRLLLQQYLSQLKPDDADYEDTVSALEVVSRVAEHANQSMSEGINSAKLLALQAKVVGKQRDIVQPGRLFVREGELLKMSRKQKQPRWFVLLSDALLYLTQIQSSDLLYLNNEFPIDDCQVSTPSEHLIGDQFHSEFHVRTSQRSFALIARSREERDQWVEALRDTAAKYLARRRSLRSTQSSLESPRTLKTPEDDEQQQQAAAAVAHLQGGPHELLGQRAPLWTPDARVSMCQLCTSNFSALFRRHHCRACGRVVCSVCSSNRAPLMYLKCRQARVCDHCFHLLKANLHLYYLAGSSAGASAPEEGARESARRLDEHFRTLLRSQFVRGSLMRTSSSLSAGGGGGAAAKPPAHLKQLGHNDSGSAISGYLHRRKPLKSKWKRRWFVVQAAVLYEYRAIDDVAPVSSLPLLGYRAGQPEAPVDGLEARSLIRLWHEPGHSQAGAGSKQAEHLFKAESVGAAERWLDAFRRSLAPEGAASSDQLQQQQQQ